MNSFIPPNVQTDIPSLEKYLATEFSQAIAKGDAKAAKFAMEQHIENLIEISLRRIAQQERERFARSLTADELVYTA